MFEVDPPTTIEDPLASSAMIWITNLPKTTKANEIKEEYEKLGFKDAIVTCKIAVNKKTQAAFGFVEMPHVEGILAVEYKILLCSSRRQIHQRVQQQRALWKYRPGNLTEYDPK